MQKESGREDPPALDPIVVASLFSFEPVKMLGCEYAAAVAVGGRLRDLAAVCH